MWSLKLIVRTQSKFACSTVLS